MKKGTTLKNLADHFFATVLFAIAALMAYGAFSAFMAGNWGGAVFGGLLAFAATYTTYLTWRKKVFGH